jgi:hypothetical protein
VLCTDIDWETDGEDVDLHKTVRFYKQELGIPEDVEDVHDWLQESLADLLSDRYGFLVNSFNFELIEKPEPISLDEGAVIDAFHDWLAEADADELARLTGELFGGECFAVSEEFGHSYAFTPNDYYCGAFEHKRPSLEQPTTN